MKNKFQVTTNFDRLDGKRKEEIQTIIEELLAEVMIENRRNKTQFDISYVQNNLKQNR